MEEVYIGASGWLLVLNARVVTRHSGDDVLIKHYLDEKVLSKVARDFEVF